MGQIQLVNTIYWEGVFPMVHNLHNARWKRFILAEQVRELITEGLDDIGLSETNKIAIRQALPTTSRS